MEHLSEQYLLLGSIMSAKVYISHWHMVYFRPELGYMNEGHRVRFESGFIRHGEELPGTKG